MQQRSSGRRRSLRSCHGEGGGLVSQSGEQLRYMREQLTGATEPIDQDELTRLFSSPPRWGYERVEPTPPAASPERQNPPQRGHVRMVPATRASGLWEATALATGGAVSAIVLDASFGYFSGGVHGIAEVGVVITNLIAATVAFFATRAWYRSSDESRLTRALPGDAGTRWVVPIANAVVAFAAPYLLLTCEAIRGWRRISRERGELAPDPGDARRIEADYAAATKAWQKRIAEFEDAERRRVNATPLWRPVHFDSRGSVTCVFGGTPLGWTAALTTLGASLLGDGQRLIACDLSRRLTLDVLVGLARTAGISNSETILPEPGAESELLEGIGWPELASVLVEALHSAQRDPDVSRRERQDDRSVIRDVAACLDPSRRVSIARLRSALLVLQDVAGDVAEIDAGERARLAALFNEVQRAHGSVLERVIRIERALRDFELLNPASSVLADEVVAEARDAGRTSARDGAQLRITGVDKHAGELENDCLVDLLFQLISRRVRSDSTRTDTLLVLGADRIRREALESLADHAVRSQTTVVLMFEHLRRDAIEMVGAGGGAAAFMTLANHREASEASEFIGSEYRWIESSHTASVNRSLTLTTSASRGASLDGALGLPHGLSLGGSRTRTRGYTQALGNGEEYSVAETREREAAVEPATLMSLPVTGMIQVKVLDDGGRAITSLDCHPSIAFSPHVMQQAGS